MSADNWGSCPRCSQERLEAVEKRERAVAESYGKLSLEMWSEEDRRAKAARQALNDADDTLREDYEIGFTSAGLFYVRYGGHCAKCGFGHDFKHEEMIPVRR